MITGKRSQSSRLWLIAIAGGAIALVLLGFGISRLIATGNAPAEQETTETATPLPERVEVVALGRLEPQGEVIRVGGPTGDRIGLMRVKQGDMVKQGEVLAVLEGYSEALAQRNYAASQLAEAEGRLRASTNYGQAQITEAQTRVQQANQPGAFEVEAQRATVRELEADLALANEDLQRSQNLFEEGAISRQELDQAITRTRRVQEQIKSAQATLVQLEASWQANVLNAQAQLRSEQANLPLSQIQAATISARENLKLADAKLERTLIRAPGPGRILRIITKTGEAIGQDGNVLDLGDTRQMYVVAEVYESDVGLLKLGQTASISSRNGAFAAPLTGKVAEIGWQIFKNDVLDDDPAANADARVVEVKIQLDDSASVEALTNLQVDVRIKVK